MTTCNITKKNSNLLIQVTAINKAIIKLNIEQLEDEILSFKDKLYESLNNPEQPNNYLETLKEKIIKLRNLQDKLSKLEE